MARPLKLQRELRSVTVALSVFHLGKALAGVFIPLVILQSGGALWQVAGFYVVYAIIKLVLNYPIIRIIQRYGAHVGLGIGFFSSALQIAAILGYSETQHALWLIAGATGLAIANAFVWSSQHLHISRVMNQSTKSSSLATMTIINQTIDIIAPLVGGLIGALLGAQWLLTAALLAIIASIWPLRKMGQLGRLSGTEKATYNLRGAPKRDIVANFFFNVETSIGVMLWPIYLAVVVKSFSEIGIIAAITGVATMVTVWLAGRRGDRGEDRAVLKEGVAINSLIDLARIFATTTATITFVSAAYKASLAYFGNAWTSTYYSHAKRKGIPYIMSMEIGCDLAYASLWSLLLAVLLVSGSEEFFLVAFLIAAASAWGCLLISRQGKFER